MKAKYLSPKKISTIQAITSFILAILIGVFSFLPIISIKVGEKEDIADLNALFSEIGVDIEIPEKVNYNLGTTLRGDIIFIKTMNYLLKTGSLKENGKVLPEKTEEFNKLTKDYISSFEDPADREAFFAFIMLLGKAIDIGNLFGAGNISTSSDDSSGFGLNLVLIIVRIVFLILICAFMHIFLINGIILLVSAIIKFIVNRRKLDSVADELYNNIQKRLIFVLILPLLLAMFDGISLGVGFVAVMLFCLANILVAGVLTRFRRYDAAGLRYINIYQACTICATVGTLICFFTVIDLGFFREFCEAFEKYASKVILMHAADTKFHPNMAFLIDGLLALLFVAAGAARIADSAPRIWSMIALKGKNEDASKSLISKGVVLLVTTLCAFALKFTKTAYEYSYDFDEKKYVKCSPETLYDMSDDVMGKLILIFVGALIIIASGIAMKKLHEKMCPEIGGLAAIKGVTETEEE